VSVRFVSTPVAATLLPTCLSSERPWVGPTRSTVAERFFRKPVRQLRAFGASPPSVSVRRKRSSLTLTSRQPVTVTGATPAVSTVELATADAVVAGSASACLAAGSSLPDASATGVVDAAGVDGAAVTRAATRVFFFVDAAVEATVDTRDGGGTIPRGGEAETGSETGCCASVGCAAIAASSECNEPRGRPITITMSATTAPVAIAYAILRAPTARGRVVVLAVRGGVSPAAVDGWSGDDGVGDGFAEEGVVIGGSPGSAAARGLRRFGRDRFPDFGIFVVPTASLRSTSADTSSVHRTRRSGRNGEVLKTCFDKAIVPREPRQFMCRRVSRARTATSLVHGYNTVRRVSNLVGGRVIACEIARQSRRSKRRVVRLRSGRDGRVVEKLQASRGGRARDDRQRSRSCPAARGRCEAVRSLEFEQEMSARKTSGAGR
jgi:hypothetical protein